MKRITIIFMVLSLFIFFFANIYSIPQDKGFNLIEEDKKFWNSLLDDHSIKNKNILYASYVAYKDSLNELSIETFQECINSNPSNSALIGVANYYIGKNYFIIGKYENAITQFINVGNSELKKFNYIKHAAMINAAITYYKLKDVGKFKESLQKVISTDAEGRYKKIALEILSQQ